MLNLWYKVSCLSIIFPESLVISLKEVFSIIIAIVEAVFTLYLFTFSPIMTSLLNKDILYCIIHFKIQFPWKENQEKNTWQGPKRECETMTTKTKLSVTTKQVYSWSRECYSISDLFCELKFYFVFTWVGIEAENIREDGSSFICGQKQHWRLQVVYSILIHK